MIMLYATPRSGNAHKVRLALAFLSLSWEEQPTDAAARQSAAFAAIIGSGSSAPRLHGKSRSATSASKAPSMPAS